MDAILYGYATAEVLDFKYCKGFSKLIILLVFQDFYSLNNMTTVKVPLAYCIVPKG